MRWGGGCRRGRVRSPLAVGPAVADLAQMLFARLTALSVRSWRATVALGPAGPLLVAAAVGPVLGLVLLGATSAQWLPLLQQGEVGLFGFAAAATLAIAACLLPSHATSLVAGYVYGGGLGSGVAMGTVLVAAWLGYVVLRRVVGDRVLAAVAGSPRASAVHGALLQRGPWRTVAFVALLRLSPVMPFAATNLLMAALGVRLGGFLLATALGLAPRVLGVAWLGAGLGELDWRAPGDRWLAVLALSATAAVLFVVGRAARTALRRAAPADRAT